MSSAAPTALLTEIRRVRPLPDEAVAPPPPAPKPFDRLRSFLTRHFWFDVIVLVPTLVAVLYFGLIASDLYVSEAKFVVHGAEGQPQPGAMASLLQNVGIGAPSDDTHSVQQFILSRDIVAMLEKDNQLRQALARREADIFQRFPHFGNKSSFEKLYQAYSNFVSVVYDRDSGISTLSVRAFRPGDAKALADAILTHSEAFINKMNERARLDSIQAAQREVMAAQQRVKKAEKALTEYRIRTDIMDPALASSMALELISGLSAQLSALKVELQGTIKAAPNSPRISGLNSRIAALEAQITQERRKVIGQGDALVGKMSDYELLKLDRLFADQALTLATSAFDVASARARQKHLYLDRVTEPNLPDFPLFPRRLRSIILVFVTCATIYGIAWLVSTSVREHAGR